MNDTTRSDVRRLLKTFGVSADEALTAHLKRNLSVEKLRVRVTLEDLTDYDDSPPPESLHLEIEEEIRAR